MARSTTTPDSRAKLTKQLISLCGLPSSGKSHRAAQLYTAFTAIIASERHESPAPPPRTLHLISEHDLHVERSAYATAAAEKTARATLLSAARRALGRDAVVLLDAPNYIKGWRYQLHCEAKALGVRSAVVQIGTPEGVARGINEERLRAVGADVASSADDAVAGDTAPSADAAVAADDTSSSAKPTSSSSSRTVNGSAPSDPYDAHLWADLARRFEEPNGMTRWDSPLYVIAWDDAQPPSQAIWNEVVRGRGRGGAALAAVKPNQATVAAKPADASHLQMLERQTLDLVMQIVGWQGARVEGGGEPGGDMAVNVPGEDDQKAVLHLPTETRFSLPHLQRLRRQFVALHRQQMGGAGMGAIGKGEAAQTALGKGRVVALFVDWLNDAFEHA